MLCFVPGARLRFRYTYKGVTEERHVIFNHIGVGTVGGSGDDPGPFPEPTIFFHCSDLDRNGAPRSFAVNLIDAVSVRSWTHHNFQPGVPVDPDADKAD